MEKHSVNNEQFKRKCLICLRRVKKKSEVVILDASCAEEQPKAEGRFHQVSQKGSKGGAIFPLIVRVQQGRLIELMSYDASPLFSVGFRFSVYAWKSVLCARRCLNYTMYKVRVRGVNLFRSSSDFKK